MDENTGEARVKTYRSLENAIVDDVSSGKFMFGVVRSLHCVQNAPKEALPFRCAAEGNCFLHSKEKATTALVFIQVWGFIFPGQNSWK